MKRFVSYVALLGVFLITLMFFLDAVYTYAFNNGEPRSKLQYIFQQKNVTYDYVFFGSSRTELHIDCAIVKELTGKSCINLGISGTTFQDTYVMMELMNAQGIEFKNAFVQVDYLYNMTEFSPNFKARLLAFNQDPKVNEILERYDNNFLNKYIPFYRFIVNDQVIGFREVFNLLSGKRSKINFENGYLPKFGTHDYTIESLPNTIIETNPSINAMIKYFAEHNVQNFFFIAPICDSTVDRDFYVDLLKTKIPALNDYVALYDEKDEGFYYDCGHLNNSGAQDFTCILTNDLILNKK